MCSHDCDSVCNRSNIAAFSCLGCRGYGLYLYGSVSAISQWYTTAIAVLCVDTVIDTLTNRFQMSWSAVLKSFSNEIQPDSTRANVSAMAQCLSEPSCALFTRIVMPSLRQTGWSISSLHSPPRHSLPLRLAARSSCTARFAVSYLLRR